jgi:hypothetical protein
VVSVASSPENISSDISDGDGSKGKIGDSREPSRSESADGGEKKQLVDSAATLADIDFVLKGRNEVSAFCDTCGVFFDDSFF